MEVCLLLFFSSSSLVLLCVFGGCCVQVQYRGKEVKFSAERITAAFLTKLRQVAEGSLQKAISEIVIACPSWFRDSHRTSLLNAAQIAGLKCLRVISDMAASKSTHQQTLSASLPLLLYTHTYIGVDVSAYMYRGRRHSV